MSLNPSLGHLYHDQTISNLHTALDVQELLRTRQRNQREQKQLGKYSLTLEKAKSICKRRHKWEETEIKQQLQSIKSRTPSLQRSLQQETDRLNRCHGNISDTSYSNLSSMSKTGTLYNTIRPHTTLTCKSATTLSKRDVWYNIDPKERPYSDGTKSQTDIRRDQPYIRSQSSFIKKAESVARSLHKLYRRQKLRASEDKELMDIVKKDNRELLLKARVFFRGTEAAHILETLLASNNATGSDSGFLSFTNIEEYPENITDVSNVLNVNNESNVKEDEMSRDAQREELKTTNVFLEEGNIASSTYVNPSISDSHNTPTNGKWTDVFSSPELWKLYCEKQKLANMKQERKRSSLVTITARYRRSLVR